MGTSFRRPGWTAAVLTVLVIGWQVAPTRAADDDKALRESALALNDVTGDDAIGGKVDELVAKPERTKKLLVAAVAMAKEKKQPFNFNAAQILAQTATKLKEVEAGEIFFRLNVRQALEIQSSGKIANAFYGLVQLLFENKKYAECEKVCKEVLELDLGEPADAEESLERVKPIFIRLMILTLVRQDKEDDAIRLVDKMIKAQPDNWLNGKLKAGILQEVGKSEEAAKVYEEVLEQILADKRIEAKTRDDQAALVRYALSGVYVDLNNIDKAAAELQTLLETDPDDPTYNNDLGYIWADHDMKLDESEKLIRKALEEDAKRRKKDTEKKAEAGKDNPVYLDSLGWVLFKQKKYKEAKEVMLKVVADKEGQHVEIMDHLADIHLALGEKAEAVAVWKKALEVESRSKREKERKVEVEKKLKANQ
jgi:predicted Zn-dependent protease